MFTEIRTQRHAAPVMSDLGERDPRNELSWERREKAPGRGAGSSSRQSHKCFTFKTDEEDQPAAERASRGSGVDWSHLGRTVEPVKRKYKL